MNASSLTRFRGLKGGKNLEKTTETMIDKGIHRYCLQETWLLGSFSATIRGHLLFHHGTEKKTSQRGQASSDVATILGPDLQRVWNMAGKPPPITPASNSNFPGRMIGITLCFPNRSNKKSDKYHKRGRGRIKIFLLPIHHPVEHDEHKRFNEDLESCYNSIPRNTKLLSGQDVNTNVGI